MRGLSKDSILRMAQEAAGVTYPAGMTGVKIGMSEEHLERFAALVAAAEREACAQICEEHYTYYGYQYMADDIRARGNDAT
jgi:hypothetical protein